MRSIPVFLLASLLVAEAAHARTLHVSPTGSGTDGLSWETAYPTVHAAMSASASGDHVWVRSATYAGDIRMTPGVSLFGGFAGTESPSEFHLRDWRTNRTVLSGGTHVVQAADHTLIDGFTVRDGVADAPGGGGILVIASSVKIENCLITNNRKRDNVFADGGGVYCKDATATIVSCTVRSNSITRPAGGRGGGIAIESTSGTIQDSTITGNVVNADGGGLSILGFSDAPERFQLLNCRIEDNLAETTGSARGGGVFLAGALNLILNRCVIARNVAQGAQFPRGGSDGGGIYSLADTDATLTNCLFDGNRALRASALSTGQDSKFRLIHCTFVRNAIERGPGVVISTDRDSISIIGSILHSNMPSTLFYQELNPVPIVYSNLEGGYPGEGNIDADPLFVDPENGDYRLQPGSPCIDAATRVEVFEDLDGNPRPVDVPGVGFSGFNSFDMGCYEFQDGIRHPNADLNGNGQVDSKDLLIFNEQWREKRRD